MPQLGLSLGLHKSSPLQSPLQRLVRASSWTINMDEATGISPGINSPFTNPVVDLKRNANVTLTNFGATTSSGFVVDTNAGKTFTMLKFDGVNDYGLAANHPNLDITGTGDFAIAAVFKTAATLTSTYIVSKNLDSLLTAQYNILLQTTGEIKMYLNGTEYIVVPSGGLVANSFYSLIVYRVGGILKTRLNKITTYNQINNVNILTRPHFRIGARSNSIDGLVNSVFTNIALAHLSIINGAVTPFTEAQLIADWDRFCANKYGL